MDKRSTGQKTEGVWQVHRGWVRAKPRANRPRSVEGLHYNNPYRYKIERVWFDGRVIFATEQGEVDVDPKKVKVAQEYQIVYAVRLISKGHIAGGKEPTRVPGQFNIDDSVPGMKKYSAIWHQLRHRPARLRPKHRFALSVTAFAAAIRSNAAWSSRTDRCSKPAVRGHFGQSVFTYSDSPIFGRTKPGRPPTYRYPRLL